MKSLIVIVVIVLMVSVSLTYAGEKEELQLKAQLMQERMVRIELQSRLLQQDYSAAQKELQNASAKLKDIEAKEQAEKGKK